MYSCVLFYLAHHILVYRLALPITTCLRIDTSGGGVNIDALFH